MIVHHLDQLSSLITSRERLGSEFRHDSWGPEYADHGDAPVHEHCPRNNPPPPLAVGSCIAPPGVLFYAAGRFFECVGHHACGLHMRPVDHGGAGVWHCISEHAIRRTWHPAVTWDGRNFRPLTTTDFHENVQDP